MLPMSPVDEYLNTLSAPERKSLERVRRVVRETLPEAQEVISYGMPGFKYEGKYLAGYCAFKSHLSFFPASNPIKVLGAKLSGFKLSKGTVQFSLEHPIPEELIVEMVQVRARDITQKPS